MARNAGAPAVAWNRIRLSWKSCFPTTADITELRASKAGGATGVAGRPTGKTIPLWDLTKAASKIHK